MYIVLVNYRDSDAVERTRASHLEWIQRQAASGTLLFTGRRDGTEGGVMIGQAPDLGAFQTILAEDPYAKNGAAVHDVIEFDPRGGSLLAMLRQNVEN